MRMRMPRKAKKLPVSLRGAPEAEAIAQTLKEKYHTHLLGVRVDCCFRSETQKTKGKRVLGSAAKTTIREEFLGRRGRNETGQFTAPEHYFVLVFSEPEWKVLSDDQRIALVDHELCHCGVTEDGEGNRKLKLLPHDIEEFAAVVRRHGLYKGDIEQFAKSLRPHLQTTLNLVGVDRATGEVIETPAA